jgi:hypothetical protein
MSIYFLIDSSKRILLLYSFDNSGVVAVTLLFIGCLFSCIYLLSNCFTYILSFGDQISVVYHSISSSVCIVVSSSLFWSFHARVVMRNQHFINK